VNLDFAAFFLDILCTEQIEPSIDIHNIRTDRLRLLIRSLSAQKAASSTLANGNKSWFGST